MNGMKRSAIAAPLVCVAAPRRDCHGRRCDDQGHGRQRHAAWRRVGRQARRPRRKRQALRRCRERRAARRSRKRPARGWSRRRQADVRRRPGHGSRRREGQDRRGLRDREGSSFDGASSSAAATPDASRLLPRSLRSLRARTRACSKATSSSSMFSRIGRSRTSAPTTSRRTAIEADTCTEPSSGDRCASRSETTGRSRRRTDTRAWSMTNRRHSSMSSEVASTGRP